MKTSFRLFFIPVTAILYIAFFASTLIAGDSLKGFLPNLDGWQAQEAQDMNMNMNGMQMINAVRVYEKGDKTVTATVMVSSTQMGSMGMAGFQQMSMEQGQVKVKTSEMGGFKVLEAYDGAEKTGTITVLLSESQGKSAIFSIACEGISGDEGLALVKKFDWKGMEKTVKDLMK